MRYTHEKVTLVQRDITMLFDKCGPLDPSLECRALFVRLYQDLYDKFDGSVGAVANWFEIENPGLGSKTCDYLKAIEVLKSI